MGEALAAGFASLGGAGFLFTFIGAVTRLAFGKWIATDHAGGGGSGIEPMNGVWFFCKAIHTETSYYRIADI